MRQRTAKRKRKSANTVEQQKLAKIAEMMGVVFVARFSLLTFSLQIREDIFLFCSDRCSFSTFVGEYKSNAIAEKREEILTS